MIPKTQNSNSKYGLLGNSKKTITRKLSTVSINQEMIPTALTGLLGKWKNGERIQKDAGGVQLSCTKTIQTIRIMKRSYSNFCLMVENTHQLADPEVWQILGAIAKLTQQANQVRVSLFQVRGSNRELELQLISDRMDIETQIQEKYQELKKFQING